MTTIAGCPLCESDGGTMLLRGRKWRLVRAHEQGFPAFYRVIWNGHVREFTDLSHADRHACIDVVCEVECALRAHLAPNKVNVASLDNAVPHLHWHVIARFDWDSRFPDSVWTPTRREAPADRIDALVRALPKLEEELLGKLRLLD